MLLWVSKQTPPNCIILFPQKRQKEKPPNDKEKSTQMQTTNIQTICLYRDVVGAIMIIRKLRKLMLNKLSLILQFAIIVISQNETLTFWSYFRVLVNSLQISFNGIFWSYFIFRSDTVLFCLTPLSIYCSFLGCPNFPSWVGNLLTMSSVEIEWKCGSQKGCRPLKRKLPWRDFFLLWKTYQLFSHSSLLIL